MGNKCSEREDWMRVDGAVAGTEANGLVIDALERFFEKMWHTR